MGKDCRLLSVDFIMPVSVACWLEKGLTVNSICGHPNDREGHGMWDARSCSWLSPQEDNLNVTEAEGVRFTDGKS